MNDETFDFEKMICFALYSTANAMVRNYSEPLKLSKTTYPQLLVMTALWGNNDVSVSQISERTLFDLGTLTPILKRMEAKGFIVIYQDLSDRRVRKVKLTASGNRFKSEAGSIFEIMRCTVSLSKEEQKSILHVCEKIKKSLNQGNAITES
jgi:DNA-binding MarR family transcriptional regulator